MSDSEGTLSIHDVLIDPHYNEQFSEKFSGIPVNWHESWDILRTTLARLEQSGLDPQTAILGLLHAESIREDVSTVDNSFVAHLKPHLMTNYVPVPTANERKDIQQYCAKGEEKLALISGVVERDRLRLASSSERLAMMHELFDPYIALLSPLRAIPPEILQEIFVACLPTRHCAIMHAAHMPLLLGRVCSGWRTILLSTPALWSSVHVVVPPIDSGPQELLEACALLKMWLQRSGDCPLSISIFVPIAFDKNLPPFVDIIVPYSRRWMSLQLLPATREELPGLWDLASEDVPLLQTLEIADNIYEIPDPRALRFLSVAPILRHLTIKYFQADVSIPRCHWEQLTSLSLESQRFFYNLDASQVMELLGQCVNLAYCRLAFPIGSPGPLTVASTPALPQVVLSHLHTLSMAGEVSTNASFDIVTILDALTLPALQELRLIGVAVLDFNNQGAAQAPPVSDVLLAVDDFISRSACDLQELVIQFPAGDVEALLRCLQLCPRLTRLDLHYTPMYLQEPANLTPLFAALADSGTSASGPLCPDLVNLRLAYCDHTAAVHPILRSLLEFRCGFNAPGVARLKRADFFLSCETSLDSVELQAAAHPSEVYITAPVEHFTRAATATWGIPDAG
ncbi:hypothetical protein B0H19DRAFT_1133891 [Mycena capillaripes]|nr:hypothetical protein B0H19DRAFT_1133891 [Mycena capillaripes]